MTGILWTPCCTRPGAELEAQRDIEELGVGTLHLSFRKLTYRQGKSRLSYRSLLPGYIFVALPASRIGSGEIGALDGVSCLLGALPERDCIKLNELAMRSLSGEFNITECRELNGQFAKQSKQRKRRRRPRRGKRVGNLTNIQANPNQRTSASSMPAVA